MNKIDKGLLWRVREKLLGTNHIKSALRNLFIQNDFNAKDLIAYHELKPYLGDSYFPLTDFNISFLTIQKLLNEISLNNKKNILEIGAGLSTVVALNFIYKNNLDISLTSVESDKEYIRFLERFFPKETDLSKRFRIVHAPIELDPASNKKYYSLNSLKRDGVLDCKYDLVLIDGPYGKIENGIRQRFLDVFPDVISMDTTIYVDDYSRDSENILYKRLKNTYALNEQVIDKTVRLYSNQLFKV